MYALASLDYDPSVYTFSISGIMGKFHHSLYHIQVLFEMGSCYLFAWASLELVD
jgi:hypothetical protein